MPITRDTEQGILQDALKTLFFQEFQNNPDPQYDRLVTIAPSGAGRSSEKYGWLSPTKGMRKFKDRRVPQGLIAHNYTIFNELWEDTLAVERAVIDSDQYGQVKIRIQQLAKAAKRFKGQLAIQQLAAGFTGLCYDGQYFFDIDHIEPNNPDCPVQSNKLTAALDATSLQTAIDTMSLFTDENGVPLGIVPDLLVVPQKLKWTAKQLLKATVYPTAASTTSNMLEGELDIMVSPYLTDQNDWFVLCTSDPVRPLILQQSDELEFASVAAGSETSFNTDSYLYGVRERFNVGYGLWQYAVGSSVA